MKKQFLYLCMCALFVSSCSDENSNLLDSDVAPKLRVAGDGDVEVLGYGYDITDDFLGETATKMEVVDVKAFKKGKDGHRFSNPFVGIIRQREFYGSTSEEYINEIIKSSNYKGSIAYQATASAETQSTPTNPVTSASFSGGVTKGSTSRYSYSSKYSFGRGDIIKKQRQYILDRKPNELTDYLTTSFKEDLVCLSADAIVLKYGTHVLLDITVGGMYTASYKSAIIATSSSFTKTKSVEAGIKLGFKGVGLDFSTSQTTSETNAYNSNNTDWKCVIDCWGGSTNGVSTTISATEAPKTTFNLGSWTQSVDDTHSKLVDVNWNATYPIYDFIVDATKKAQIKAAVERYIKSKQVKVLEILPLYKFYWNKGKNTHYVTSWNDYMKYIQEGHEYEKIDGYIVKDGDSSMYPLHKFYWNSGKNTHYVTTEEEVIKYKKEGHQYEGIIGYIYKKQITETIPLHKFYWNSGKNTHYVTTEEEVIKYKKEGHQYEGIIGYIYK